MNGRFRGVRGLVAGGLAVVALAACTDARVSKLSEGIGRDSVLKILASNGATQDTLPHVYRAERYLSNGENLEIFFYTKTEAKAEAGADSVPEGDLTPIVLREGKVTGWGWAHYDSVAKVHNLAVKPR